MEDMEGMLTIMKMGWVGGKYAIMGSIYSQITLSRNALLLTQVVTVFEPKDPNSLINSCALYNLSLSIFSEQSLSSCEYSFLPPPLKPSPLSPLSLNAQLKKSLLKLVKTGVSSSKSEIFTSIYHFF